MKRRGFLGGLAASLAAALTARDRKAAAAPADPPAPAAPDDPAAPPRPPRWIGHS